jgi:hypothetical protein
MQHWLHSIGGADFAAKVEATDLSEAIHRCRADAEPNSLARRRLDFKGVSMLPDLNAMLQSAIQHVKANRKAEARRLLEQIVSVDQMNEQAWLWLSACVETAEEQAICLENVLEINPNNQKARKGLQALQARLSPPPSADPFAGSPFSSAPAADPFAGSSFGSASTADPFAGSPFGSAPYVSSTPTSVEWGRSASREPAHSSTSALSDEDYDAWLASLPLGTSNKAFASAPLAEGPFSPPADQFADDPSDFDFGSLSAPAPSADKASQGAFDYAEAPPFAEQRDFSADALGDETLLDELQPDLSLYEPPESLDSRPFEEGDDVPLTAEDILRAEPEPAPVPISVPRPRLVPPSLFGGKQSGKLSASGVSAHYDSSDPFSRIPAEIEAASGAAGTQLPLDILILAGLNAAALIALVINLFS